jgi:hypothetical protein
MVFNPILAMLPPSQLRLWQELDETPESFTLYGGKALTLRMGHRVSVDFYFFSNRPFDPDELVASIPYLKRAERVQVAPNTLTCRIDVRKRLSTAVEAVDPSRLPVLAPYARRADEREHTP